MLCSVKHRALKYVYLNEMLKNNTSKLSSVHTDVHGYNLSCGVCPQSALANSSVIILVILRGD